MTSPAWVCVIILLQPGVGYAWFKPRWITVCNSAVLFIRRVFHLQLSATDGTQPSAFCEGFNQLIGTFPRRCNGRCRQNRLARITQESSARHRLLHWHLSHIYLNEFTLYLDLFVCLLTADWIAKLSGGILKTDLLLVLSTSKRQFSPSYAWNPSFTPVSPSVFVPCVLCWIYKFQRDGECAFQGQGNMNMSSCPLCWSLRRRTGHSANLTDKDHDYLSFLQLFGG